MTLTDHARLWSDGAGGRVRSLARAELLLLWRNRMTLLHVLFTPVAFVALLASANTGDGALALTALFGFLLLSTVYHPLVSTYVARRESLVLKRLRVGELTDGEILAGAAVPVVLVGLAQAVLAVGAGALLLGLPTPVNPPLLLLGMAGGLVLFTVLAAASAAFTATVELAQITTLPVLLACMLGSGLMLPRESLPGPVAAVAEYLPLTPVVELLRLGWLGTADDGAPADFAGTTGAAGLPVVILAAWVMLAVGAVRRRFRWEPRS
ncbi:ABC transporter permease [Actinoplanes sp. NPDC049599]|uniref:ABC transporter permease n=1 Tax=Actinoplanes sp. NPDC049599 TaxID=3363903 RepID=UPI003794F0BB